MRQQPATRTTTIRPRTTTNESRRLVGEFLWVSPPTVGPIDLPPPPTSRCDSLVGFSGPNEFPHHHESPRRPTAPSDGQQRPTEPTTANEGPQQPTEGQHRPTKAHSTHVTISLPHSLFPFLFYFPYLHRWNPLFYIYLFYQNFLIHMPFLCFLHSLVHSFYLTSIASRLCTSLL